MEAKLLLVFIILITAVIFSKGNRYCELEECPNESHTLCKYKDIMFGENCEYRIEEGMTLRIVKSIIDFHNFYRTPEVLLQKYSITVPYGTHPDLPVMPLEWDMELAFSAQKWANQCESTTDTCRNVDRFDVIQRVSVLQHYGSETEYRIESGIQFWSDEEARNILRYRDHGINHYGNYGHRLPWNGANKIGCGYMLIKPDLDDERTISFFVCNYGYMDPSME